MRSRNQYHSKHGAFLLNLLLLLVIVSFPVSAKQGKDTFRFKKDTLHFKIAVAEKKGLVLTDSMLNEIGLDSLLNKVQNVHLTLDRINNTTSIGFDIHDIEQNFAEIDSNVDNINENLTIYNAVLDVKNLQMFHVLLGDIQGQVSDWRDKLNKYNKELSDMGLEMAAFRKDTILKALFADSAFKSLYQDEITGLRAKWKLAKQSIIDNQSHIKQWLAIVTNEYFETLDLQNKMRNLYRKISNRTMGKEYDYIWNVNSSSFGASREASQLASRSYQGQQKILKYYFRLHWVDQFWIFLAGVLLFIWFWFNIRRLKQLKADDGHIPRQFPYLGNFKAVCALAVLLNLTPLFDLHPPTAYVDLTQLLLVIVVTVLTWKNWQRELFGYWLVIAGLFICFSITSIVFTPSPAFRFALLALNAATFVFGIFWYRKIKKHTFVFSTMIRVVSVIFIVLNFAAVACNMLGRVSLAKIFSITAIHGLTQVISLSVLIQVALEALQLQTAINHLKGGLIARLDFHRIQRLITRGLIIVSVCLWSIVFAISLNIYGIILKYITMFLTTPRKMGSMTFQIGSIVLFVFIIYVSHMLQKGVGSLLGKGENWDPEVKKNSSRLAMTRLVLIVLGFLIAVAASGLPVDKITIVLGALGVGIGLGLQSIVNNLVSGVILIFEQPFRIGDYIQLADKKGRVLDIGIRSSKLIMEDGAELIMPNADLLSGAVINWTTRDDSVRIALPVNIETGPEFEKVQKFIVDALKTNNSVVTDPEPEILLTSQSDKMLSMNILVWISDVHRMQAIRSELLTLIVNTLSSNGIKIV